MSRAWIALALLLLPVVVYWPTIAHEFGFRDDYAHLREVRERPGWLTELTTANGRPVYGLVLEASVQAMEQVPDLSRLRLLGAALTGLAGVLLWWHLRRRGWAEREAAAYGALVTLLPGAQIIASWAIGWPIALGLVAAIAGFALVDRGFETAARERLLLVGAGLVAYLVAGLTYQTSAMFVMAPLAAVVLARRSGPFGADARFVGAHVAVLFVGLVAGFVAMNLVFAEGVVREAARMRIEPEPFAKLLWFVRQPLPNSIAMFVLRDRFVELVSFWLAFAGMLALIAAGFVHGAATREERWRWLGCVVGLPLAAHSVSLAASSQAIGYRTLLPISGVFLALALFAVRSLAARYRVGARVHAGILGLAVAGAAVLAGRHAFALMAEPQGREWGIIKAAAESLELEADTDVYIIRPSITERSTERVYADEYGSLTADADWAVREMFKAALRQRYPAGLPPGTSVTFTTSFYPPAWPPEFDLIVDMRTLARLGDRAPQKRGAS